MSVEIHPCCLLHFINEVIFMGTFALWRSNQEKVEVEAFIDSDSHFKNQLKYAPSMPNWKIDLKSYLYKLGTICL
jgi:hypothetical protein